MVNNYTSGVSLTSICKNMLPFSFKKRRGLPAAERRLSEIQLKNLKWQQEAFHQIIKLVGLQKEGILSEAEVSEFKSHLMDSLMEVNLEQEHNSILRDKLLFLQELYFAKCILEDEYHSMKSLLLHRLSVAEGETETPNEWSIVEFKDKTQPQISQSKSKNGSSKNQQIKGSASVLGLVLATHKNEKALLTATSTNSTAVESLEYNSTWEKNEKKIETKAMLMMEKDESGKRDKSAKKPWGFTGFKKWKRKNLEDEATTPLPPGEVKSYCVDGFVCVEAVDSSKQTKRKLQSELSLEKDDIKSEQSSVDPKSKWTNKTCLEPCNDDDLDDQLEAIWANSGKWATFGDEEDENCNPNLFLHQDNSPNKQLQKSYDCTNPFADNYNSQNKPLVSESISFDLHTNLFWTPMSS
ncbi:hypothetical protein QQ045_033648 [Rhodiola kirilowii]